MNVVVGSGWCWCAGGFGDGFFLIVGDSGWDLFSRYVVNFCVCRWDAICEGMHV